MTTGVPPERRPIQFQLQSSPFQRILVFEGGAGRRNWVEDVEIDTREAAGIFPCASGLVLEMKQGNLAVDQCHWDDHLWAQELGGGRGVKQRVSVAKLLQRDRPTPLYGALMRFFCSWLWTIDDSQHQSGLRLRATRRFAMLSTVGMGCVVIP